MINKSSNPSNRLLGNRRKSNRYFIYIILAIIIWLPGQFIYQSSFGYFSGFWGSSLKTVNNNFFGWLEKKFSNEDTESLKNKIEKLNQENALLKENVKLNKAQFEKSEISSLYNLQEVLVIGNDNFFNTPLLFLFGGENLNIKPGSPVLDDKGSLIGTVKESQAKLSQVILTPNHESRIGAVIAGTEWNGILEGNRDLRAVLEMLPLESNIKEGDQVVTDNRNPVIPAGILLGTITLVKESDDHLFKEALLDLPYNSKKLNKVWIITGRK